MQITMPDVDNEQHIFKDIRARWFVPRVIYFDLESLILPVSGAEPDPDKSHTQITEQHKICGCGLAVVDNEKSELIKFELKQGPEYIESLLQSLETLARETCVDRRRLYAFTLKRKFKKEDATQCWICAVRSRLAHSRKKSSTIAITQICFWVGPTTDASSIANNKIHTRGRT